MNFAIEFRKESDSLDIELRKHSFVKFYNLDMYAMIIAGGIVLFVFIYQLVKYVELLVKSSFFPKEKLA